MGFIHLTYRTADCVGHHSFWNMIKTQKRSDGFHGYFSMGRLLASIVSDHDLFMYYLAAVWSTWYLQILSAFCFCKGWGGNLNMSANTYTSLFAASPLHVQIFPWAGKWKHYVHVFKKIMLYIFLFTPVNQSDSTLNCYLLWLSSRPPEARCSWTQLLLPYIQRKPIACF